MEPEGVLVPDRYLTTLIDTIHQADHDREDQLRLEAQQREERLLAQSEQRDHKFTQLLEALAKNQLAANDQACDAEAK